MVKPTKSKEILSTTFDLGFVYANMAEGEEPGEIVESGFSREMRESKKTGKRAELDIFNVKVKFSDGKAKSTYLIHKTIVSRAENSRFIQLLKEFDVSFEDGKIDVTGMVGEKVVAVIRNNEDEQGLTYSNIESIKKVVVL
ncbi:hypothetical protein M3610_13490 [Neobacillus sp. MER 74]|uniref:hypothetical protein n=1 Tax=Neobacillus sp. MER 74 TaxID=2939566 RepID=UPI00203BE687|nr:hypothetical protein [Neobacillus sp. MER 74]MCM3116313.1 hypothetical protein [Neobacillus sp. MER 74]